MFHLVPEEQSPTARGNRYAVQSGRWDYPYCSRSSLWLGVMGQSIREFTQFLKGSWQNLAIFEFWGTLALANTIANIRTVVAIGKVNLGDRAINPLKGLGKGVPYGGYC